MQQHIKIIAVGKMKEPFSNTLKQLLNGKNNISIAEVIDEPCVPGAEERALSLEGDRILKLISPEEFVIALAIEGEYIGSKELKAVIMNKAQVTFVIGGSFGLSKGLKKRADRLMSFSALTYPHQLMRIILIDTIMQIYTQD